MESISIFDMFKIGVGPSSSHTLGPWKAARLWLNQLKEIGHFNTVREVNIHLYGSLSLTGKGHETHTAIILGLSGYNPETIPSENIKTIVENIEILKKLYLDGIKPIEFHFDQHLHFEKFFLPTHANGMKLVACLDSGNLHEEIYYSIGGGFIMQEVSSGLENLKTETQYFPYSVENGKDLLAHCNQLNCSVSELVLKNELSVRNETEIYQFINRIWDTMLQSMYRGCHTSGELPGGLKVKRRAMELNKNLIGNRLYQNAEEWIESIRDTEVKFRQIIKWVACFAIAVNEENAAMGRVVTAPTNGSAGVIPAVLMYYLVIENHDGDFDDVKRFLLTASEIGSIFKKGATLSAAMGGCQAEIGVSSAMAAAGLAELLGGTPEQVVMAAEIAMEHHLGLTCDPIAGLVQIPCIERNSMGAIKAINAAELALDSDPKAAKVPLDKVVQTMWETAKDMNSKYKETSEGGLAVGVHLSDC